jgi:hypothetical protein
MVVPADLSTFDSEGPVIQAAVQYGTSTKLAERINTALGPYFVGLGPLARSLLVNPSLAALSVGPGARAWTLVSTSAEQVSLLVPCS